MSGFTARTGFRYQDLYLLYRVLRDASDSLDRAWQTGVADVFQILDQKSIKYAIEASSPISGTASGDVIPGPDWDVLVLAKNKLDFAEVKSGAVMKDDRLVFWRRIRRELASPPNGITNVVPVLVVDPKNAGDLTKWHDLASTASKYSGLAPSVEPMNDVRTAPHLLDEALWWLCRPDNSQDKQDPAVEIKVALDALGRFELHCHDAAKLDSEVSQLIELLFPGGLADTDQTLLLGWLSKRATASIPTQRFFSMRELLAEVGILEHAISLTKGTLKDWLDLWNEVPRSVVGRTHLRLGEAGESLPAALVQSAALDALAGKGRCFVILGQGGAGKSALLAQAAEVARQHGDVVLHCGADDVTTEELENLVKAFRFHAAQASILNPNIRVSMFVDGLDEAESPLRKRWGQLLMRLTALPNASLLVSVREAVWKSDGDLRKELDSWPTVTLTLWPEEVVRRLLDGTQYRQLLSQSVITLLRTPILLDIFWRTFVESGTHDVVLATRLQTRYNLLAAYWEKRILNSPRHAAVSELHSRLGNVFSIALGHIGPFPEVTLDTEVIQVLLSEGVFIREGRLQPRLRFRHPLLRDFAFAQWCLAAETDGEVARRWNSIQGGLQRYGALRAVFEALLDVEAKNEYQCLNLENIIRAIIRLGPALASQVAQVLGTHEPAHGLDPARWPSDVQLLLPSQFAHDLLTSARLDQNGLWATWLESWPDAATWLNREYPKDVWAYASVLLDLLRAKPSDQRLREQCRCAARKLREMAEVPQFSGEFNEYECWLRQQAVVCVVPLLADDSTLDWIERQLQQSSWRICSSALEVLSPLARVDEIRAAKIYRKAVGLSEINGRHTLSKPFGAIIDHQAIEWSLGEENGRGGLLKQYPVAFLPAGLELAEALWHQEHINDQTDDTWKTEVLEGLGFKYKAEEAAEYARRKDELLNGLIDDSPEWRYWRSLANQDAHKRSLTAIHESLAHWAKIDPERFISILVPLARKSRLASVHSILLDVLLFQYEQPIFRRGIIEMILDGRLYHISGIVHWLEKGVIAGWPLARPEERAKVFEIIRVLLSMPEKQHNAENFLLRIPNNDIPEDLRPRRPPENDPNHQLYARPQSIDLNFHGVPIEDDDERAIGTWPDGVDHDVLKEFARATKDLIQENPTIEQLRENVPVAICAALLLLPAIETHQELLQDPSRRWMWQSLAQTLNCFRKLHENNEVPPDSLIRGCTELAMVVLRNVPSQMDGKLPEDNMWVGCPDTPWVNALRLADAVLTWHPVASDLAVQREFMEIVEKAFLTNHPLIQLVCTTSVRPWHWLRSPERRQLHDRLIWNLPTHASVLIFSLGRIVRYPDQDRVRIYKLLLNRQDLQNPKILADHLGQFIGRESMCLSQNGGRHLVSDLAREIIAGPNTFGLLHDKVNCNAFLRAFVFGMKEQASVMWFYTELAADYGNWALAAWRMLRLVRHQRMESEGVILLSMHWLEKKSRQQRDIAKLKVWWENLQPLRNEVVAEGQRPDCFTLFFTLRDGQYNDLVTVEEIFRLATAITQRILSGFRSGNLDLKEIKPELQDWHSWRDITECVAETIDSLQRDGSLRSEVQSEQAHLVLSRLAAEPICSSKASEVLHQLQNE